MPILVRPVREQLEHDRIVRLLQAKYKRKFDVGMNPGMEQNTPVGAGTSAVFPDLVLQSNDRSRRLLGIVEVETSESVNNLEAMAQWAALGRLRAPFHLYVPTGSIDTARRLCADFQIAVAEIWTYHPVGDQMRFTLVQRSAAPLEKPVRVTVEPRREPARAARPDRPGVRTPAGESARPARRVTAAPAARRKTAGKARTRPKSGTRKAAPARSRGGVKKKTARK